MPIIAHHNNTHAIRSQNVLTPFNIRQRLWNLYTHSQTHTRCTCCIDAQFLVSGWMEQKKTALILLPHTRTQYTHFILTYFLLICSFQLSLRFWIWCLFAHFKSQKKNAECEFARVNHLSLFLCWSCSLETKKLSISFSLVACPYFTKSAFDACISFTPLLSWLLAAVFWIFFAFVFVNLNSFENHFSGP